MKFGILGDLHLMSKGPSRRTDNFSGTQMKKLSQSFDTFKNQGCDLIIQPGDFFDTNTVSNEVKSKVIRFLRSYIEGTAMHPIQLVAGQHDLSGHSLYTLKNSPLAVLQAAGVARLLNKEPSIFCLGNEKFNIFGANYGEPIPKPEKTEEYNILVIHKMIGDRELFPGQELYKPNQFLRNNPEFNLVICGDYHYTFCGKYQGRTIINAGCLVRKTISKFDLEHHPSVAVFDTETNQTNFFIINHLPAEEVFDLHQKTKLEKFNNQKLIDALKSGLTSSKGKRKSAKDILLDVIEEENCPENVKNCIDEILEEISQMKK